jgi:hypothetical protein
MMMKGGGNMQRNQREETQRHAPVHFQYLPRQRAVARQQLRNGNAEQDDFASQKTANDAERRLRKEKEVEPDLARPRRKPLPVR